jgi:hypothetical protein
VRGSRKTHSFRSIYRPHCVFHRLDAFITACSIDQVQRQTRTWHDLELQRQAGRRQRRRSPARPRRADPGRQRLGRQPAFPQRLPLHGGVRTPLDSGHVDLPVIQEPFQAGVGVFDRTRCGLRQSRRCTQRHSCHDQRHRIHRPPRPSPPTSGTRPLVLPQAPSECSPRPAHGAYRLTHTARRWLNPGIANRARLSQGPSVWLARNSSLGHKNCAHLRQPTCLWSSALDHVTPQPSGGTSRRWCR